MILANASRLFCDHGYDWRMAVVACFALVAFAIIVVSTLYFTTRPFDSTRPPFDSEDEPEP